MTNYANREPSNVILFIKKYVRAHIEMTLNENMHDILPPSRGVNSKHKQLITGFSKITIHSPYLRFVPI